MSNVFATHVVGCLRCFPFSPNYPRQAVNVKQGQIISVLIVLAPGVQFPSLTQFALKTAASRRDLTRPITETPPQDDGRTDKANTACDLITMTIGVLTDVILKSGSLHRTFLGLWTIITHHVCGSKRNRKFTSTAFLRPSFALVLRYQSRHLQHDSEDIGF